MKRILMGCIRAAVLVYFMFQTGMVVARNKDKRMRRMQDHIAVLLRMLEMKDAEEKLYQMLGLDRGEKAAVYGNGVIGKQIVRQLSEEGIEVSYVMDRMCSVFRNEKIPVYRPDMRLPQVDVVIITPYEDYLDIREKLEKKITCRFVSAGVLLEEAVS